MCFRLKFATNLCQFDPSCVWAVNLVVAQSLHEWGLLEWRVSSSFVPGKRLLRTCMYASSGRGRVGCVSLRHVRKMSINRSVAFIIEMRMRERWGGGGPNHARGGIRHTASQQGNKAAYSQFFPRANFRPCFWVSRTPQCPRKRNLCGSSA